MKTLFVHSEVDDAGLSLGAFRVLAHLSRRAGRARSCYPSIAGTAEVCRMSRPTVIRAVAELERTGWIEVRRRAGMGSVYRLAHRSTGLTGKAEAPVNGVDRSKMDTGKKEASDQSTSFTGPVKKRHSKVFQEGNPRRVSKAGRPDLSAWSEFCASIGWSDVNAVGEAFDYWESVDWERKGGRKVKNWRAVARNAKRMAGRRGSRDHGPRTTDPQADGRIVAEDAVASAPPEGMGPDAAHLAWLERHGARTTGQPAEPFSTETVVADAATRVVMA